MKFTILGSGTIFPTVSRFSSGYLLETDHAKILLDCGQCILARLITMGIDIRSIDGIFISHFHTDHMGDLFNLIHSRRSGDVYQNTPFRELKLWGPEGLKECFGLWRKIFWPEPDEYFPLEFFERSGDRLFEDIHLEMFPVRHVPWFDSVGVKISVEGKTIVYPGDIGSENDFEMLVGKSTGADLLLIEPGYDRPSPNHFNLEQILELSNRAKIKQTAIIHLRPLESEEERIRNFCENYPGFIYTHDLMEIEI